MPRSSFSTANVRSQGAKFPRLKLEKKDDHARIKLAESDPTFEWVHNLRKPKLAVVDSTLIMERKPVGKPQAGEPQEYRDVPVMEFVGNPICFGNIDALEDKGVDPDHCMLCAAAMEHKDWFNRPERRWAVHVFQYATQGNSTKAQQPLNVTVRVWAMSDNRYARVVSVLEEFTPNVDGDPLRVDLTLGPCTSPQFQNYEVQGSPRCELALNPAKWGEAEEIFAGNNAGDLSPYCGRPGDPKYVRQDVDEIIAKWRAVRVPGSQLVVPQPDFAGTLANANLLDAPAAQAPPREEVPTASVSDIDSTVGGDTEDDGPLAVFAPAAEEAPAAPSVPAAAPAAASTPVPETPQQGTASFASLMEGLGVKS